MIQTYYNPFSELLNWVFVMVLITSYDTSSIVLHQSGINENEKNNHHHNALCIMMIIIFVERNNARLV